MAEEIEVVQSVMTVSSCVYAHGFSGLPVLSADVIGPQHSTLW